MSKSKEWNQKKASVKMTFETPIGNYILRGIESKKKNDFKSYFSNSK